MCEVHLVLIIKLVLTKRLFLNARVHPETHQMNVYVHSRPRVLGPDLELWLAVGKQRDVRVVEGVIELWEVAAQVGATALGACQRGLRDQPHERVRVGSQRSQARAVALQSGVAP